MREIVDPVTHHVTAGDIMKGVEMLQGCPRCGQDHAHLDWHAFTRVPRIAPWIFTHWGSCPTNGEPILLGMTVSA